MIRNFTVSTFDQREIAPAAFPVVVQKAGHIQAFKKKRIANMQHRMHHEHKTADGPATSGAIIHGASQYDICNGLLGMGVNRPNSRMIIEMAKIKPGDKVLDVGCGTGNLTLTAKRYVGASGSAYGID